MTALKNICWWKQISWFPYQVNEWDWERQYEHFIYFFLASKWQKMASTTCKYCNRRTLKSLRKINWRKLQHCDIKLNSIKLNEWQTAAAAATAGFFAHDRMMSELEMTPDGMEGNGCIQIEFQINEKLKYDFFVRVFALLSNFLLSSKTHSFHNVDCKRACISSKQFTIYDKQ